MVLDCKNDKEKDVRELTNCKFINCSLQNKYNFLSSCQYNSFFVKGREVENLAESCVVI